MPHQMQDKFMLRLPDGMRDELKAAAKDAGRSMNAEITARLSGLDTAGLRDRFAGQALPAHQWRSFAMFESAGQGLSEEAIAREAYDLADAMLASREAR